MAKIIYYLGAGASFYACPILDRQAEMMIELANYELHNHKSKKFVNHNRHTTFKFDFLKNDSYKNDSKATILHSIGYFGKKAKEYNTIDTFARKLYLNDEFEELNLLKFCVSVFFDLFENFKDRYNSFNYENIDSRYKSLFSILIEKRENIKLNDNFKFITWNYDLQLEESFNLFLSNN